MSTAQPALVDPDIPVRRLRGFRLLWMGESISLLGTSTSALLLSLVAIVGFHAGPGWMGVLTAAGWLPWLVVGLPAGAMVDSWEPRRVMICASVVAAVSSLSVPVAGWLGVLSLTQLVVVAAATGTCSVFFLPAFQRLLPELVPEKSLVAANSALQASQSTSQLAGPPVGGLLAQWVGAATGVLLDGASFLVAACCLLRIRPADRRARRSGVPSSAEVALSGSDPTPLRRRIATGMRVVTRDRFLRSFMIIGGLSNLGLTGYGALLILLLVDQVGLSEGAVGLMGMAAGLGGVLAAAVTKRLSARIGEATALRWLRTLGGPPALLLPLVAPGPALALYPIAAFAVAFFVVAGNIVSVTFRQRYIPGALMGRVITCSQLVAFGTMPVAGLLAGWLGGLLGVRETIAVMAAIHCAACLANLFGPLRGLRSLPQRLPEALAATS